MLPVTNTPSAVSSSRWRGQESVSAASSGGPLAVFDALAERFVAPDFRGCASINTMVETADPDSTAHRVAAEHKHAVTAYLDGLLEAAGHHDHAALPEQFMMLIDGAIVTALRERTAAPAHRAKAVAAALLAVSAGKPEEPRTGPGFPATVHP